MPILFPSDPHGYLREINNQSQDEELFSRVQREFKSLDPDECGFLLEDKLPILLTRLSVPFASNPTDVNRFSSSIQLDGGLILWSTFWENISKILTGTSLNSLLESDQPVVTSPPSGASPAIPSSSSNNSIPQRRRSDSEIARELQASFDSNPFYDEQQFQFPAAVVTSVPQGRARSDSELARQMEEEWNRADDSNPPPPSSTPAVPPLSIEEEESLSVLPSSRVKRHRSDSIATKDDENFVCYHYNGLEIHSNAAQPSSRRQNLTRFKLYRRFGPPPLCPHLFCRSRDTAVGQSIGLSTTGGIFSDIGSGNQLEEVLRTRWTGCRVDYLGNPSPAID